MIISFTGPRNGMTDEQKLMVEQIIMQLQIDNPTVVFTGLHGDCVGGDEEFDGICMLLGIETSCRPCTYEGLRAYCTEAESDPVPPMERNRQIVAKTDIMIACPPTYERIKSGSGTWATIGFTEKAGKPLHIIYPDGSRS